MILAIVKSAKEYIYVGKNLNWVEAVSECRSMKAELALIESEEQNKKVGNFLCRAHMGCKNWNLIGGVWIGYFLKQDEKFQMMTSRGEIVDNSSFMNLDESWNIPAYSYHYQYDDDLEYQDFSEIDLGLGVSFDYNNSELPPLCYQENDFKFFKVFEKILRKF